MAHGFPIVVSHCVVDAGGVPAEWVEATVATTGQPTLIYVGGDPFARGSLETARPLARNLAVATGARVFSVGCWITSNDFRSAVEKGVVAYAWLLGEGIDLDTTAFVDDPLASRRLSLSVILAASERGLPLPAGHLPRGAILARVERT